MMMMIDDDDGDDDDDDRFAEINKSHFKDSTILTLK
jgi:hypothetical protein